MSIRDRVFVVTGASSGIGRTTARSLAARGALVAGVARRTDLLDSLQREMKADSPRSFVLTADLGVRDEAQGAMAEVLERVGRIDVLVNNAGVPKHKHIWHTSVEEAEDVMRINFLSCVWTTFAALPVMLREGAGTIVNISSMASRIVPPRESLYAASKAALDAFTEGLWCDLEGSGIHAGLVIVGPIDTEIWDKLDEPSAYRGRKHPPEVVTRAILDVVEKRKHQVMAPRWNFQLGFARGMRAVFPGLVRSGVRRMDPVARQVVEAARGRAEQGLPLGQDDER